MKRLVDFCIKFSNSVKDANVASFAGSVSFFIFLSIIPIFIILGSIFPFTHVEVTQFIDFIGEFMPSGTVALLQSVLGGILESNGSSVALVSAAAIMTLFVAGKGFWALMCGLDAAYNVKERRNIILLRIWGSFYTICFLALLISSFLILVYGSNFADMLEANIKGFSIVYSILLDFRFFFIWALFIVIFMLIYTFIPNVKLVFHRQFPGALFAAIGWTVISYVFTLYLEYFSGYSMYGSLTTLIISFFWLYYCMYVILYGAVINLYFNDIYDYIEEKIKLKKCNK